MSEVSLSPADARRVKQLLIEIEKMRPKLWLKYMRANAPITNHVTQRGKARL